MSRINTDPVLLLPSPVLDAMQSEELTALAKDSMIETVRDLPAAALPVQANPSADKLNQTMLELARTRDFLTHSLSEIVGNRLQLMASRGPRLQRLCGLLCAEAAQETVFRDELTPEFILLSTNWILLLDVGYLMMHDSFLLKPGKLTPDEREKMQEHTTLGAELLARIASKQPAHMAFFHMPIAIARYHHERYDGTGYPDRLVGMEIPLAARITSLCDVYDAMRSQRAYKTPLSHSKTVWAIMAESGHYDPHLLRAFERCAEKFNQVYLPVAED
jgi:putative two-component system response regulator